MYTAYLCEPKALHVDSVTKVIIHGVMADY